MQRFDHMEQQTGQSGTATRHQQRVGQTLLAIVAVILVGAMLQATASVTLPLVFAFFLAAVFWPLQRRFAQHMPRGAAVMLSLLAFLLVVSIFMGLLWLSGSIVAQGWQQYSDQFAAYQEQARRWAQGIGLSLPGGGAQSGSNSGMIQAVLTWAGERAAGFLAAFVLVIAFLVFGLLEATDFQAKLNALLPRQRAETWFEAIHTITNDFQRYIVVRTVIGLITGVLITLFCWIIGLDFAIIWGLSNFLLNYIPTLGSIIAVVPPVLFGLVQFESIPMALLVLLGVGGVQFIMGQYIDPLLQGKYLALSPLVVLLSVTFWGWLWGIAGAFIGVPLTIGIVIACNHFDRTRWIATMLAEVKDEQRQQMAQQKQAATQDSQRAS
jgi:predicted PurR-regulated permease PerM